MKCDLPYRTFESAMRHISQTEQVSFAAAITLELTNIRSIFGLFQLDYIIITGDKEVRFSTTFRGPIPVSGTRHVGLYERVDEDQLGEHNRDDDALFS